MVSLCVHFGLLLIFPRGTVNVHVYTDDIIDAYVSPYVGAIGDDFLIQEKNNRPTDLTSQQFTFITKQLNIIPFFS